MPNQLCFSEPGAYDKEAYDQDAAGVTEVVKHVARLDAADKKHGNRAD
jgi:hypothetical protein